MVAAGTAEIASVNGRVRSIKLMASAATHAERIGEPEGRALGVRFAVREHLDCGAVVWRHHRRCRDYE